MSKHQVWGIVVLVWVMPLCLYGCGQDQPLTTGQEQPISIVQEQPISIVQARPTTESSTPDPIIVAIALRFGTRIPLPTLDSKTANDTKPKPLPTLPACTPLENQVVVPDNFAPNFPFPPGISFTETKSLNDNSSYLQVIGFAPLELQEGIDHILTALPSAGYILRSGDAEATEAEATFTGNGFRGGVRVATLQNCDHVTQWTVVVIRTS